MTTRSIGELIVPILERAGRLHGVQSIIAALVSPSHKKRFIMAARERGSITDEDARLLVEAHMLEGA